MRCQHDAGIEDTGKRTVFNLHRMHCRDQNPTYDFVHDLGRNNRRRAIGSHSSGVWPLVIVVGSFMILSDIKRHNCVAIDDRQNTGFLANQTFFDDNLRSRVTEGSLLKNRPDGSSRFGQICADENALPCCETIGLHNQRLLFAVIQILHGFRNSAEDRESGRGNVGPLQQLLGEDLAAFQASGSG